MRTEIAGTTRRIIFDVQGAGGASAVLNLVPGEAPSGLYLWIGAPGDGPCLGTIDGTELRRLARAILRESGRRRSAPMKRKGRELASPQKGKS